jgi:hypothetical protein
VDFGIALTAVQLLAPFLVKAGEAAAAKVGEAMWERVAAIHGAIRRKLDDDDDAYGRQSLERLEEQPTSEGRQQALATVLYEKAEADQAFGQELVRLVQQASQERSAPQFLNQVYDGGKVNKIIQIAQGGQIHIE